MHKFYSACLLVVSWFFYVVSYAMPRFKKKVVMGAWKGLLFSDNPKYLLLYMLEYTDFHIVWIGEECVKNVLPEHPRLVFARKKSWSAFWSLMTAKTWICCQSRENDLTTLKILGRARCINLWHGIPIKFMGKATVHSVKATSLDLALCGWRRYVEFLSVPRKKDWLTISSSEMARIMEASFPTLFEECKFLRCGMPRIDYLLGNKHNRELIAKLKIKYAKQFGFDYCKKIVLYLPTWRINNDNVFAFYNLDFQKQLRWRKMLNEHSAVLLEKHHFATYSKCPYTKDSECSYVVTAENQMNVDVQELLLIADILISDYSSVYIDYGLLRRPVLHYVYDLDKYCDADSGLAYELDDVAAGPIIRSEPELYNEVIKQFQGQCPAVGVRYADLVEFEHGDACAKIVEFIKQENGL